MSIDSTPKKALYFFAQPEEEQIDLEKLTPQEVNQMALYVHQLAGEIYQLSLKASLRALQGDRFAHVGKESSLQLRALPFLCPKAKTETKGLKQMIAGSHLSKTPSFSQRKSQVDPANCSANPCKVELKPKAHEEHVDHDKSSTECLADLCIGKACHLIEHTNGKPIAIALDILANTLLHAHKDQKNPDMIRDSLVSAATHLCMLETLTLLAPGRVPVYAAAAGSHIVAAGARAGEKALDKMAACKEVEYWWNKQVQMCPEIPLFASTVCMAKGLSKIAQFPSDLLNSVHHHIDKAVKHDLDGMGLTDEHVAATAIKTLIFIGKNSPEYLEQDIWCRAAKAIAKKTESPTPN